MPTNKQKHILIAPLDWGLGHTARCVPLISYIQSLGHIPMVACSASQRNFMEDTFADIDIIHLDGYRITYSSWNRFGQAGLLWQIPRIRKTIASEHEWLKHLARDTQIDGVISDNRYGLFLPGTPSAILTHQLQVQTGLCNLADRWIQRIHYKYLNRFDATWVVDIPGNPNLGGSLSHCTRAPAKIEYIGLLSRFAMDPTVVRKVDLKNAPLMILLSGPEPQRTNLSRILWEQVLAHKGEVIFIEGKEDAGKPPVIPPHIAYYKRLTGSQLFPLLEKAGMVICRSGYSTIMDLVALSKKAILIPTPGQTEQLYLGKNLHKQSIFYCTRQGGFNLNRALTESAGFPYLIQGQHQYFTQFKNVIDHWITRL